MDHTHNHTHNHTRGRGPHFGRNESDGHADAPRGHHHHPHQGQRELQPHGPPSEGSGERPRGGRGGRGGHGGRGGRGGPRAGRGDLRAVTLSLLAERPLHGYELIQQIAARSGDAWRPSPGSIYPALQLLADQGLIQGEESEGRRVYQLTEAGLAYVAGHSDELAAIWAGIGTGADGDAMELRHLLGHVESAVGQMAQAGTAAQIAAARDLLASTRRQLYRILADDEPTPLV